MPASTINKQLLNVEQLLKGFELRVNTEGQISADIFYMFCQSETFILVLVPSVSLHAELISIKTEGYRVTSEFERFWSALKIYSITSLEHKEPMDAFSAEGQSPTK